MLDAGRILIRCHMSPTLAAGVIPAESSPMPSSQENLVSSVGRTRAGQGTLTVNTVSSVLS